MSNDSMISTVMIDVREADEFKKERVPGSVHLPLSQLDLLAPGLLKNMQHCQLTIMCRSGGRAKLAHDKLVSMGLVAPEKLQVFSGGILEWKRQGKATEGGQGTVLPLMRQVQLGAGLLTLLGSVLTVFGYSNWIYLSLFVGAGLTVAGATGFCGMAILLQRMPWNRQRVTPPVTSCSTSV